MSPESETIEFGEDLEQLRERRQELQAEIDEIEEELEKTSSSTDTLRENLQQLKTSVQTGRVPSEDGSGRGSKPRISRVKVNPETGKPRRGARAEQIQQAIDVITDRQETFKAAELFELIQDADPNVTESQRAYLYSKLNELRDDGILEKVKRGTWTLAD